MRTRGWMFLLGLIAHPALAPLSAQTVVARLINDAKGYRVEPADIQVPAGGSVQFVVVGNGPHSITFEDTLATAIAQKLTANMPNSLSQLSGPMLLNNGETYTISFAGLPPGHYGFHCGPHAAMNERGDIIVAAGPPPAQRSGNSDMAAAVTATKQFLRSLVVAEESFFADSSRYTFKFDELPETFRRSSTPPGFESLTITMPVKGSWRAVVVSRDFLCAVGVASENPLLKVGEGEPVCVAITAKRRAP